MSKIKHWYGFIIFLHNLFFQQKLFENIYISINNLISVEACQGSLIPETSKGGNFFFIKNWGGICLCWP
jgi:hypothetical protein